MSGNRAQTSAVLTAVWAGTGSTLLRLVREGFVVRAIAWPGLLSAGTLVVAAAAVALWGQALTEAPGVALDEAQAQQLGVVLEAQGLRVLVDADPASAVAQGRAERAAWPEGSGFVLAARAADPATLRVESVLRDDVHAAWRLDVPPDPPRARAVALQSGRMGLLTAVLFTLYGVVMGAGLAWRDLGEGVVEACLPLPVPAWTHGLSRLLGLSVVLSIGLAATVLLLHGLLGMDQPGRLIVHASLAATVASGLGLAAVAGPQARRTGFSAPLSRALGFTAALLGLGAGLPQLGAWVPVASLAALARSDRAPAGLSDLGVATLAVLALALCAGRWGRHQGGLGR